MGKWIVKKEEQVQEGENFGYGHIELELPVGNRRGEVLFAVGCKNRDLKKGIQAEGRNWWIISKWLMVEVLSRVRSSWHNTVVSPDPPPFTPYSLSEVSVTHSQPGPKHRRLQCNKMFWMKGTMFTSLYYSMLLELFYFNISYCC